MKMMKYDEFIIEKVIHQEITLPNDIKEIAKAYHDVGKELYVVGGAIRDFLQGKTPHDYDLTTNALPDESKKILKDWNVSDEQGKKFGVLRVFTKNEPLGHEIASFRKDISGGRDNKGDDEKVEIGEHITIEDDCMRRDLTINSIFYDINKKEIVDLVGGIEDIKNNIIRCVGNPSDRFREDRLRILRCLRFTTRIDGKIDKKTSNAIHDDNRLKGIGTLDDVSQERIWEEMCKAFDQSKNYNNYLELLTEFDMWDQVFPGADINSDLVDSKNFTIIITNLFKNDYSGNDFLNRLVQEYRIEGDLATKVEFLINFSDFDSEDVCKVYKKKRQCEIDDNTILEWMEVNNLQEDKFIKFVDYRPSISSQELMAKGFRKKALGDEINRLEVEKFQSVIKG